MPSLLEESPLLEELPPIRPLHQSLEELAGCSAGGSGPGSGAALTGLVSRYYSVGQLAGAKALVILVAGKSPAQVPVETLKRFSLLVNMQVARSLRLYPPIDMLNYAEVIAIGPTEARPS